MSWEYRMRPTFAGEWLLNGARQAEGALVVGKIGQWL